MKKLLSLLLILASFFSYAQTDSIPIPMKNGIVFYEKYYPMDFRSNKNQQSVKALQWFGRYFSDVAEALKVADIKSGKIAGAGAFKVIVGESGNYFWIQMQVAISVTDSGYLFQSYDYYEKPVEKGVSNEYSKIEYRWRDYRQGKPWSPEDQPFFRGIHENTLAIMASLEKAMH
ncbi:MAG TPA: hypothetical protein VK543_05345 [Puia sp.]|nr:hypothetical protein [Puia sp.]